MKLFASLFSALFVCWSATAYAGQASAVSADDAHTAVAQGAYVVDVRSASEFVQGHLPLAASLPSNMAQLPLADISRLLSQAGVDSSRSILIVGDAGDVQAQALWHRLAQVASGRVLWLVGGVQEWQMRGHMLTTEISKRPPVPQFLAPFDAPADASRMAGSRVRTSALLERNLAVQVAMH